jgi:Cys-tRNA(Pro)/Cys-tRNA(Cys) deacylase
MAATDTPATRVARAAGVDFQVHAYHHDPAAESYGLEAAAALGVDPARVFKTLMVLRDDALVVCVLPVAQRLALKALGKPVSLAPAERAEKATGYVVGGISPLGQRRALATLLDTSALAHPTIYVSAGRRGLELELSPADLVALTGAEVRGLT